MPIETENETETEISSGKQQKWIILALKASSDTIWLPLSFDPCTRFLYVETSADQHASTQAVTAA